MATIAVITAIGRDRPGIVAGLAKAILTAGANIDDATMTRLHNAFATMLSVALPDGHSVESLREALVPVGEQLGLRITVLPVDTESSAGAPSDYVLTVYGADHPGIVHAVAEALSERGVNINDMISELKSQ